MSNGTFSRIKSLMNGPLCLFSMGILLASSLVISSSLLAGSSHNSDDRGSKCHCSKSKKGPQGDVGRQGPDGDNSYGGLDSYASFLKTTTTATEALNPGDAIQFGDRVAGNVNNSGPIEENADSSVFTLSEGTYKIAVGISTFGTLGAQLQVSLNENTLYNWPLRPTTSANTSFIELTFIIEVTQPQSKLMFSTNVLIPATAVINPIPPALNINQLQNYLNIEKIY